MRVEAQALRLLQPRRSTAPARSRGASTRSTSGAAGGLHGRRFHHPTSRAAGWWRSSSATAPAPQPDRRGVRDGIEHHTGAGAVRRPWRAVDRAPASTHRLREPRHRGRHLGRGPCAPASSSGETPLRRNRTSGERLTTLVTDASWPPAPGAIASAGRVRSPGGGLRATAPLLAVPPMLPLASRRAARLRPGARGGPRFFSWHRSRSSPRAAARRRAGSRTW